MNRERTFTLDRPTLARHKTPNVTIHQLPRPTARWNDTNKELYKERRAIERGVAEHGARLEEGMRQLDKLIASLGAKKKRIGFESTKHKSNVHVSL